MKPTPACETTQASTRGNTIDTVQDQVQDKVRADAEALTERVLHALERVTWPAHPATLIQNAEDSGATSDVIDALRDLPDEAFGSFPEVSASIIAARLRAGGAAGNGNCAT